MSFRAYGIMDIDEINNIYTCGSHQYALYFWLKCAEKYIVRKPASLIHIDFHADFLSPHTEIDVHITSSGIEDLIVKRFIRNDNFIKIAQSLGIVKNMYFCCKPHYSHRYWETVKSIRGHGFNVSPFTNYVSPIALLKHVKEQNTRSDVLDVILDIDLDFFVDFESDKIRLKEESKIIEEIRAINELFKLAKITTVCTSHDWSWKKELRERFQKIFSEQFAVKIDFSINPNQIYGL
jgi:hypothetical protein